MKQDLYAALRGEMKRRGVEQAYIAKKLDKSMSYVSARFTGRQPWSQEDQYALMDLLHLPYDRLHVYFPKGGKTAEMRERPPSERELELVRAFRTLTGLQATGQ